MWKKLRLLFPFNHTKFVYWRINHMYRSVWWWSHTFPYMSIYDQSTNIQIKWDDIYIYIEIYIYISLNGLSLDFHMSYVTLSTAQKKKTIIRIFTKYPDRIQNKLVENCNDCYNWYIYIDCIKRLSLDREPNIVTHIQNIIQKIEKWLSRKNCNHCSKIYIEIGCY